MDEIYVVQFVQRAIKDRRELIMGLLEGGSLSSMEQYKELMGNLDALNYISQELSGLLEKQELSDD